MLAASTQTCQEDFDAAPTFKQSYAPQSGEIAGSLEQMKGFFSETKLDDSHKEEMASQKANEDLKKAKTDEIIAAQDQIDKKKGGVSEDSPHGAGGLLQGVSCFECFHTSGETLAVCMSFSCHISDIINACVVCVVSHARERVSLSLF